MSHQNLEYIKQTYELAKQAVKEGNHPFAAVAVLDGRVVALALNQVVTQNDSTRHAELNLASDLSRGFSRDDIHRVTVYSSTEPCVMCAGALFWVGCRNIVYGCSTEALGRHASQSFTVGIRRSLETVLHQMMIQGPVLEAEGEVLHEAFWKNN